MSEPRPSAHAATTRRRRLAVIVLVPLALAACAAPPADHADNDQWRPKGLNAANLAAMVEDPADLVHGRGDPAPDRKLAAHAVTDLWTNPVAGLAPGAASTGGGTSGGATPAAMQPLAGGASAGGGQSSGSGN